MDEGTRQPPAAGRGQTPLVVRPGEPADAPSIAKLIVWENSRPADAVKIERYLGSAPCVVATLDGELVGMIYSRRFSPDILEWRNSLVAAAQRRTGVGAKLVRAMEQQTRDAGYLAAIGVNCWKHVGTTKERASAARAFWRAMGWTIIFATDGSAVVAKHF